MTETIKPWPSILLTVGVTITSCEDGTKIVWTDGSVATVSQGTMIVIGSTILMESGDYAALKTKIEKR